MPSHKAHCNMIIGTNLLEELEIDVSFSKTMMVRDNTKKLWRRGSVSERDTVN